MGLRRTNFGAKWIPPSTKTSSKVRISWRPTGGRIGDIAIYDHESNPTTRKLAKIKLAIHSIDEQIAHGFTVNIDRHPNLKGASPALVFGEHP